ncbi:DUF4429 domain-containing protein [Streptomyces lydicus]|uniref:DUF4429 domain-containing protein n=1 Tax=Streptomyces lydicus TaxID=47763 RepID=UPI0037BD30C6
MAELMGRDGSWSFDGEGVRIVPGRERGVHKLRQDLGEFTVPLTALAGIAHEPARKGGRLRLRLRDGADPLLMVTGGGLPDDANPYRMAVDAGRVDVAEYFVDTVRQALLLEQIPDGPCDRYLLPGPAVPLTAAGVDGPREFALADLAAVEWRAAAGLESGYLRFRTHHTTDRPKPEHDPNSIELWGFKKESGTTALLAAAVTVRLPHPAAGTRTADAPAALAPSADSRALPAPGPAAAPAEDHDALLRRLRELGTLRQEGILTEDEFTATKAAVLRRFHTP